MRSKSEELMLRIREYIESYFERYSSTPTVREIAGAMKIAVSSAHRYLVAMAEKDMVSYEIIFHLAVARNGERNLLFLGGFLFLNDLHRLFLDFHTLILALSFIPAI